MAANRNELVYNAIYRTYALMDTSIHNNVDKKYEFQKQTVLTDKSLTKDEKSKAIELLTDVYDHNKVHLNEGAKRICENCNEECLATSYCEQEIFFHVRGVSILFVIFI